MASAARHHHFPERLPPRAPPATRRQIRAAFPLQSPTHPGGFALLLIFAACQGLRGGGTANLWIPGMGDVNLWITGLGGRRPHDGCVRRELLP